MDPVSVAASIIAVATALYTVGKKLRIFAATLAHAGKEITAVAKELNACSTLFRSLRYTIERVTPMLPPRFNPLKLCNDLVSQAQETVDEFDRFLKNLKPLRRSKEANVFAKTLARLRWAFQRTDLLLLRSELDSSKTTINLFLGMIHLQVVTGQIAATDGGERDPAELRRLKRQV